MTQSITHDTLRLTVKPGPTGTAIQLDDRTRGQTWNLPSLAGPMAPLVETAAEYSVAVSVESDRTLQLTTRFGAHALTWSWTLEADHVSVEARVTEGPWDGWFPATGSWHGSPATRLLLPIYQGLLLKPRGTERRDNRGSGGHGGLSLGMGALLDDAGGLLLAPDDATHGQLVFGETPGAGFDAGWVMGACSVDGWPVFRCRLYPVDPDPVAVARLFRRHLERDRPLATWKEKRAQKPSIDGLFGTCLTFIGYNRDDALDYVESTRRLKAMGFPKLLLYPVRFVQRSTDFQMGGDPPIHLPDDTLAALKAIDGVGIAPWVWTYEELDTGDPETRATFRIGRDGQPIAHWRIDDQVWYRVCTWCQAETLAPRLAGDMSAMTWLHFDVNATVGPEPCFATHHAGHPDGPLSARGDLAANRHLFSAETVGDRIVSSEGFTDRFLDQQDIGSTKLIPNDPWDAHAIPVPLTSLVLHDVAIHDHWEIYNYNPNPAKPVEQLPHGDGRVGAGFPQVKACLDAIAGQPPNLFPFGRQYGWTNFEARESFAFQHRLEDAAVQEAIAAAVPVAHLHARIGPLAMTGFRLLTEDGTVQESEFADGTTVTANLGTTPWQPDNGPALGPLSWRVDPPLPSATA